MRFSLAAGAALAALSLVRFALAHEAGPYGWIANQMPRDPHSHEWCCGDLDCRTESIREVAGGYQAETGEIIPSARVIWKSPDGTWIRCRYLGGEKANQTRCLIGPPPGS